MDINGLFFKQLQFSSSKQNLNSTLDISKKSSSFDSHYQSYKKEFEQKANNSSNQSNTKKSDTSVKPVPAKNNSTKKIDNVKSENNSKKNISDKEEISDEFIQELADKLNVSVDKIQEILDKLDLEIFDLLDKTNLLNFMTELMDISNPVEFLTSEDTQNVFKAVTEIVQKYDSIFKSIENVPLQQLTEPNIENISDNNATGIKDTTENLNTTAKNNNLTQTENVDVIENNVSDAKIAPTVEIKDSTKNSGENKSNSDTNQNQNSNSQLQTANTNYMNAYTAVDYKQQQIVNDIVSNVSNLTNSKDTNQIISQIVDKIKVEIKPDVSEMKLLLKPDTLGELSLKITTHNNIVTAQFIVENQQVKEVLQANFNHLKDTLQQLGLIIDEVSVSVGQQNSQQRQHFEQSQEKSRRRMAQIINSMDTTDDDTYDSDSTNPYEISDNQVDYMA